MPASAITRATSTMELNEESPGRRQKRLWTEEFYERIRRRQTWRQRGRIKNNGSGERREFQLLRLPGNRILAFGFFPGRNGLAQRTRMLAIEGAADRLIETLRAQIVRQHARPRHRLQKRPIRAEHGCQRKHQEHFTDPGEHGFHHCENFHKVKVKGVGNTKPGASCPHWLLVSKDGGSFEA